MKSYLVKKNANLFAIKFIVIPLHRIHFHIDTQSSRDDFSSKIQIDNSIQLTYKIKIRSELNTEQTMEKSWLEITESSFREMEREVINQAEKAKITNDRMFVQHGTK